MARPVTITVDQIIAAARSVFLEKGIRATTAEVAKKAGVAEGSIFNRFKTKEALFCAAMVPEQADPNWHALLAERPAEEELRVQLLALGAGLLGLFRSLMPMIMMSWSNTGAGMLPEPLRGPNPPPVRVLKLLSGFFEREMGRNRLARHEPEIAARLFLGSIQNYAFFEIVLRTTAPSAKADRTFLSGLVEVVWSGLAPDREPQRRRRNAGRHGKRTR